VPRERLRPSAAVAMRALEASRCAAARDGPMGILRGAREWDPSISAVAVTPTVSFESAGVLACVAAMYMGALTCLAERI
jgi:hypothetical protein